MITIMPDAICSGIPKIDFEVFNKQRKFFTKFAGIKVKGLFNWVTKEQVVNDLDAMLGKKANRNNKKITEDVLPCLIMSFYEAEDPQVAA